MFFLVFILTGCILLFLVLFLLERQNIKQITKALQAHNRQTEPFSNKPINLPSPNKNLEHLILEINILLDENKTIQASAIQKEHHLRQQIANISHDLRTPLTAILGYTQLAQKSSISKEDQRAYLNTIEKRSGTLQTLLNGFYDLSRLEADEYPLTPTPVSLHQSLCTLLAAFYDDFLEKDVTPEIHLDETLPNILADDSAITRIFTNLIQNSLKYGKSDLRIDQHLGENCIKTSFINDAPHLTAADVPLVFDRFFTADRMRTGQNTGLGLSIVKHLVEAMGHHIQASLKESLFTIEITWWLSPPQASKTKFTQKTF